MRALRRAVKTTHLSCSLSRHSELFVESPEFFPVVHLASPLGWPHWNFIKIFGKPESVLSCGVVCVMSDDTFAVLVKHRPVIDSRTDGQTDAQTGPQHIPR